jgi:phenylalanyl-tRNA synthetase beta chain
MADELPPQRGNLELDFEEGLKDILAGLGLQEVITYRLTSPEYEDRRLPPGVEPDGKPYVELRNPIASDRYAMRKSLLASVLEIVESNLRFTPRVAVFEVGHIYLDSEEGPLPDEKPRLVISLTGPRTEADWVGGDSATLDFFDLKGMVEEMLAGMHIEGAKFESHQSPSFHPGKCARVVVGDIQLGVLGELHPAVQTQYEFSAAPVAAADFDLEALLALAPARHDVGSVSPYPPVLEDIALILDEDVPASEVEFYIRQMGGVTVTDVRLFDVYRGEQIGAGKKSLAYSLTYQAPDRTLTDKEVAKTRNKIVKRLEREVGAKLRS